MDLFKPLGPLAYRLRPKTLSEYFGQSHILGEKTALSTWIEKDKVPSLLLWGPPGCGKTTLAEIIAEKTGHRFERLSAVQSGVKDIKETVERALAQLPHKTILFVDEIHRFNKSQQDSLLPYVENGTFTLIGATTENPSYEMNRALLSRMRVIRLERLTPENLEKILERAISDSENGLGGIIQFEKEAISFLAETSDGDARRALTTLENISISRGTNDEPISVETLKNILQSLNIQQPIGYDKRGDEHYAVISAFIKSVRGSDVQAALYYLARMLEGGEDLMFICRRIIILASEDIGNADPRALMVANECREAVEFVGHPESRIILSQAVTYLALAPKSNSAAVAIDAAIDEVQKTGTLPVPSHLRSGEGAKNYRYAHAFPGGIVAQDYLPEGISNHRFFEAKDSGAEKVLKERQKIADSIIHS
ncbi:MAG: replication-associated recombination protein A [Xanthomonadaceae bacterium]|nr:replication-associated recombination protein A [Xanthomonadaceae bacterium]